MNEDKVESGFRCDGENSEVEDKIEDAACDDEEEYKESYY